MENYNDIAKRFIAYHKERSLADKQIEAVTAALIGAIGEGYKVKALNYNPDELISLDLTMQKEVFNESGKSVEELESSLGEIYETQRLSSLYLNNEMDLLKMHYSMSPNGFLSKYIFIPNHIITGLGEDFNNKISEILTQSINSGCLYSMMTNEDGIMIFGERKNCMSVIKDYLKTENTLHQYELLDLEINDVTQYYLGYLYIQQHEGKTSNG